jgi:hypothetical protein
MIWILLIIILIIIGFISYKYGEIHELHKIRAEFDNFMHLQNSMKDVLKPGVEAAEHIVDEMIDEESHLI